jgi:transcriptional regulator with GAF, ATPase, and Fis domain
MELTTFEKRRTSLVEFLIVLIMMFLGLIMFLAYGKIPGLLIPGLVVLALFTCLYVLAKERHLRKLEGNLVQELLAKNRKIDRMGHQLEDERHELKHEKGKAAEIEELLSEISSLYRAISAVNAEEDDDKVAGAVLRAALKLVGGNRGSIMLLDNRREHLYIASALGLPEEIVSVTLQKVGEGVAGWVAESGESVLLNTDASDDGRFVSPTAMSGQVRCAMCVPLKFKNAVMGVMNLGSTEAPCEFTDIDMRRATIFGEHASVSIMNARLMLSLASKTDAITSLEPAAG